MECYLKTSKVTWRLSFGSLSQISSLQTNKKITINQMNNIIQKQTNLKTKKKRQS